MPLGAFDEAKINLYVSRRVLRLKGVNVVSNRILLLHAAPVWQFSVQCLPSLGKERDERDAVIDLLMKLGDKGQIELECETYGAQPALPLEEDDDPEAEEGGEDTAEPVSRMQEPIEKTEAKKRKSADS